MNVKWIQWERQNYEYKKTENGEQKTVVTKKTVKMFKEGTVRALIDLFEKNIPQFKQHYFTWKNQSEKYQQCINSLNEDEALKLCDISENYTCKIANEIQSMHFGASKHQITLHTGNFYVTSVLISYWKQAGTQLKVTSVHLGLLLYTGILIRTLRSYSTSLSATTKIVDYFKISCYLYGEVIDLKILFILKVL